VAAGELPRVAIMRLGASLGDARLGRKG
jgi:hypothetical protein